MSEEIKIEKNIQIPESRGRPFGGSMFPFNKMEIGDSFFVERQPAKIQPLASRQKKFGKAFTTRKEKNGVRVWRIA